MNIKRFFGKNSREALKQVRLALGDDAIIISNRAVDGGNEIMAASEDEVLAATQPPHQPQETTPHALDKANNFQESGQQTSKEIAEGGIEQAPLDFDNAPTLLSLINQNKQETTSNAAPQEAVHLPAENDVENKPVNLASEALQNKTITTNSTSNSPEALNKKMAAMLIEMRNMRSQMSSQMTAMNWNSQLQNNPVKSKIISTLLTAKFSAALSRKITEKLPNELNTANAHAWIKEVLSNNINVVDNEDALFEKGGAYALVGPTGVGKTTTTAKLAARYVMKHGTENIGLITTDGYRIGGHEQLRIYGKILGVMVHAVKDQDDLKIALNELKNKHMILIDTVGISQRDQMVTEQIAMLSNAGMPIQKLLCLNATSTGETLTDVVKAYKGRALDGCIITKLDEAASSGGVLDVIIREKIKLYYTTHGQRVPEDIAVADKQSLIAKALTLDSNSWAYQYLDEELPFVISDMDVMSEKQEANHV